MYQLVPEYMATRLSTPTADGLLHILIRRTKLVKFIEFTVRRRNPGHETTVKRVSFFVLPQEMICVHFELQPDIEHAKSM